MKRPMGIVLSAIALGDCISREREFCGETGRAVVTFDDDAIAHGYDLPIQHMREIIAGGRLGRVRMIHTWNFTDWVYRPRRPDELLVESGGGVTFRQGSHQFDIVRLLGGGEVKSVRATIEALAADSIRSS